MTKAAPAYQGNNHLFMNTHLTIPGVAAIVALIIGFSAGYYVPHGSAATLAKGGNTTYQRTGGFMMRGGAGGASMLAGTIAKTDTGALTLSTRNGNSQVVLVTPDTTVMKSVVGELSDVQVGTDVLVTGAMNSDGSFSAQSITIRPSGTPIGAGG